MTIIFVILQLCGVIAWPWIWVFTPLYVYICMLLIASCFVLFAVFTESGYDVMLRCIEKYTERITRNYSKIDELLDALNQCREQFGKETEDFSYYYDLTDIPSPVIIVDNKESVKLVTKEELQNN